MVVRLSPKFLVILSESCGVGARAASILAESLPEGWRVVLVDRNTYVTPLH